jgi:hypothetical protein
VSFSSPLLGIGKVEGGLRREDGEVGGRGGI